MLPRIVAIDYGTQRVGVAVADPLRMFAQPFGTFAPGEALARLQQLQAEEGIAAVVVGWPLTEAGTAGPATKRVQRYVERLENALPGVEIVRWDERYTSEIAKQQIYASGSTRKRRADKGRVDAAAAGIILQEYLEAMDR